MAYIDKKTAIEKVIEALNPSAIKAIQAKTAIEKIPNADVVEVKHGKWITLEAEIGLYSCSLCGHKILRAECNYCPNCGAKMDGGSEENDHRKHKQNN